MLLSYPRSWLSSLLVRPFVVLSRTLGQYSLPIQQRARDFEHYAPKQQKPDKLYRNIALVFLWLLGFAVWVSSLVYFFKTFYENTIR